MWSGKQAFKQDLHEEWSAINYYAILLLEMMGNDMPTQIEIDQVESLLREAIQVVTQNHNVAVKNLE